MNRFAGVKPAGRRRLLLVERDGEEGGRGGRGRAGGKKKEEKKKGNAPKDSGNAAEWRALRSGMAEPRKVEAGRAKTAREDGNAAEGGERYREGATKGECSEGAISPTASGGAGCTPRVRALPFPLHQGPISSVSAGVARVSYRCVYNLPHSVFSSYLTCASRGDKRGCGVTPVIFPRSSKRKRWVKTGL